MTATSSPSRCTGRHNYPFRKEDGDLDLALPDGAGDDAYLAAVDQGLEAALHRKVALAFYVAGADPFHDDRLGRLGVSRDGLAERDRRVLDACRSRGIPVAVVMAGGYARNVDDTVAIHEQTIRTASRRVAARSVA